MNETETTTETVIPEHLRVYIPQGRTIARMPALQEDRFEAVIRESDDSTEAVMWVTNPENDEESALVHMSADMCAKFGDQLLFMAALLKRRESDR